MKELVSGPPLPDRVRVIELDVNKARAIVLGIVALKEVLRDRNFDPLHRILKRQHDCGWLHGLYRGWMGMDGNTEEPCPDEEYERRCQAADELHSICAKWLGFQAKEDSPLFGDFI